MTARPLTAEDVAFSVATLQEGRPSDDLAADAGGRGCGSRLARRGHDPLQRPAGARHSIDGRRPADPVQGLLFEAAVHREHDRTAARLGRLQGWQCRVGRFIEYERVKDWWGDSLPVFAGQNNFDVMRVEMFRDRQVSLEGFKGGAYWFREEFTSRFWANSYDFPAIKDGRVDPLRAAATSVPRARRAGGSIRGGRSSPIRASARRLILRLRLRMDQREPDVRLLYPHGLGVRELADEGRRPPSPDAELALLEPFRGKVPDEVFGEPFSPPVSDGSGQDRKLLRRATELLRAAGWTGARTARCATPRATVHRRGPRRRSDLRAACPRLHQEPQACSASRRISASSTRRSSRAARTDFDFDLMPRR